MTDRKKIGKKLLSDAGRILLCAVAGLIMSLNINTFVHTGELLPGGFSGLTILIQNLFSSFFGIELPYSPIYILMNIIPAAITFRKIGKRFTIFSFVTIIATGLLTDFLPHYAVTSDMLLISVFGGIINGFSISLCLIAGATSGGTDFISIAISEKYHVDAFNYILIFNAVMLTADGFIFGWEKALYSIIFQFVCTQVIHLMYQEYQQKTLLIVTNNPEEVCRIIKQMSQHSATVLSGEGSYEGEERSVVFSVIGSRETNRIVKSIREKDPTAFIDIMKTDRVAGRFSLRHFS